MIENIGELTGAVDYFLVLTALILTGSIAGLLLSGRILLPSRQNQSRARGRAVSGKKVPDFY